MGRVGPVLDLPALRDGDRLVAALVEPARWGPGVENAWLRDRYAELAPMIIPGVLASIRDGAPPSPEVLAAVAESAVEWRGRPVPISLALRGGVPAVGCFARFLTESRPRPGAREMSVALGRAGVLAQELGACWVESWREQSESAGAGRGAGAEEVERLGQPAFDMVARVASGQSTDEIARATAYSPQAVKWHLARVMRRWGVGNRAALVAAAFTRGVLRVGADAGAGDLGDEHRRRPGPGRTRDPA